MLPIGSVGIVIRLARCCDCAANDVASAAGTGLIAHSVTILPGLSARWAFFGIARGDGVFSENRMSGVTRHWAFVGHGRALGRTVRNCGPYMSGLIPCADYSLASARLSQTDSKTHVFGLRSGCSDNSSDTP